MLKEGEKAEFIVNIGKISTKYNDDLAESALKLHDIEGINKVSNRVASGESGAVLELEVANKLKTKGYKIDKISKDLKKSNGEIDIILKDKTIYEIKGWSPTNINDLRSQLGGQIQKYKLEYPNSQITIVRPDSDIYFEEINQWVKRYDKVNVIRIGDI